MRNQEKICNVLQAIVNYFDESLGKKVGDFITTTKLSVQVGGNTNPML